MWPMAKHQLCTKALSPTSVKEPNSDNDQASLAADPPGLSRHMKPQP